MKTLLLLRSYGDFMIAIAVFRKAFSQRDMLPTFDLIASIHLQPLFEDLLKTDPGLLLIPIQFKDFSIRHKILGIFTNRYFFSGWSIKEVNALKQFFDVPTNGKTTWLLEQKRRSFLLSFLTGIQMDAVHRKGNVYDSYARLVGVNLGALYFSAPELPLHPRILILPESRKRTKMLAPSLVTAIASRCLEKGAGVKTAFFKKILFATPGEQDVHVHFIDLIRLIQEADLVLTADSLPAHLAQFMAKPHLIIYPNTVSAEWLTPYAREHHMYATFSTIGSHLEHYLHPLTT